jgi:copper resistance protein C
MNVLRVLVPFLVLALLAVAPLVEAHANAESSIPAFGSRLDAPPETVAIQFTQAVESAMTRFTLIDSERNEYPLGPVRVSEDRLRAEADVLEPLPSGGYILQWETRSAVDGHTTRGSIPFGVGAGATIADVSTGGEVPRLDAVLGKTLAFIGISLAAGAFAFWYLVLPSSLRSTHRGLIERCIATGAILQVGGLALFAYSQFATTGVAAAAFFLGTEFGRGLLQRLGLAAVLLIGIATTMRRPEVSPRIWGALAVVTLVTFFVYGRFSHSATYVIPSWIGASVDGLHLVTIGIWTGGLVVLMLFLKTLPKEDALLGPDHRLVTKRFSDLATGSVVFAGASGIFLVWAIVGFGGGWMGTDYGRALGAKIGLAGVMILLGGINKWAYVRRFMQGAGVRTIQHFRANVKREVAIGVVVFLLAGAVTNMGPQEDAGPAGMIDIEVPYVEEMLTFDMETRNYDWTITFHPPVSLFNETHYIVELIDRETQVRETGPQFLRLTITYLDDPDLGATEVRLERTNYGNYDATGAFFNVAGDWLLTFEVTYGRAYRESVDLEFTL